MQTSQNSRTFIGWLCIMPYFVGVVFLTYYGGDKLESALIFMVMGLFSLFAARQAHLAGIRPFKWWDGKFNADDLKWIGIGYASLLAVVLAITYGFGGGSVAILIALVGGGIILFLTLVKGETVLVPLITHGIYNTTALALAGASVIPASFFAFYVPNFNFDGARPADFITQIVLQTGFVAFGEELLKISLSLGMFVFTRSRNLGIAASIGLWTLLHSVQSYRISWPF